jgi:hypothetical protein
MKQESNINKNPILSLLLSCDRSSLLLVSTYQFRGLCAFSHLLALVAN